MNKNINWNSIATPLDIRNVYAPRNFIRKWNNYNRTETGVHFLCELANGNPIDYYVDVIQDDIIRLRMNPNGLKTGSSDMLVQKISPASMFDLFESEGTLNAGDCQNSGGISQNLADHRI